MNEDRASRYHRLSRSARVLSVALGATLLLTLLASGGSLALRHVAGFAAARVASPPHLVRTVEVIAYVILVYALNELIELPLAFYRGYLLETRYGLSRETAGGWLHDHLKAAALGLVFATTVALLIYHLMDLWPMWWWAIAAAILSAATIGLTNAAPVLLLPLFYTFTPLARDALRARLIDLASRAGAPVVGVYEWSLGQKTKKANAALTGLGRTRRILVSDTLLADYSDDEIEVILAHELSHHIHHDIWAGIGCDAGLWVIGLYAAHRVLATVGPSAGLQGMADVAGLPLVVLGATAASLVLMPLTNAWSRAHELRADRDALELTGNHAAFVSAMRRLGAQNLAEERPSRTVEVLFHTHPPIGRRIAAAEAWMRQRRESFSRRLSEAN